MRHATGLLVTCSITESFVNSYCRLYKTLINPVSESNSTCFFLLRRNLLSFKHGENVFHHSLDLKQSEYNYNMNSISDNKYCYSFKIFLRF